MAETPDQVRPLAPAADRLTTSSDDEAAASAFTKTRRRRWQRCCGYAAAIILVQAAVIVVLIFTVFRVRDPVIKMNNITVLNLELINGTTTPRPGSNITLNADVSVKNPNFASFKYQNTTTMLYYRAAMIGEARGPSGRARARRTMRMNITVDVITDRVLEQPELGSDVNSGVLTMSSFTEVGGRVKILGVRKHVKVRMNCTMTVNITSQAIQHQKCRRKVKL